jgi:hypothetical protein
VSYDDSTDYKIIDHIVKGDGSDDYYTIVKRDQPYSYHLRIKSFLTAAGRSKIADVVISDIDNCVRIQTDGILMKRPLSEETLKLFPTLVPEEDKTTKEDELMVIEHVNSCKKIKK